MKSTVWIAALFLGLCAAADAAPASRKAALAQYKRGAAWLVKSQNKNGSWGRMPGASEPGELGMTGLAVLALSDAPGELRAGYRVAADRGAAWMLRQQRGDGAFTQPRSGLETYRTAVAIMALSAHDAVAHKPVIAKARSWLVKAQLGEAKNIKRSDPRYGGWGYGETGRSGADMSNLSMVIQALKASGLSEDDPAYKRALVFITRCQNNSETNKGVGELKPRDDGGFIYTTRAGREAKRNPDGTVSAASYGAMTYSGLMSLLHSGVDKDDPRVKAALVWIRQNFTLEENAGLGARGDKASQAGLYYYYFVFAKCLDAYGEAAIKTRGGHKRWPDQLVAALEERQKPDGSWVNEANPKWWEGQPVIATTFALNALNRALRYLRASY